MAAAAAAATGTLECCRPTRNGKAEPLPVEPDNSIHLVPFAVHVNVPAGSTAQQAYRTKGGAFRVRERFSNLTRVSERQNHHDMESGGFERSEKADPGSPNKRAAAASPDDDTEVEGVSPDKKRRRIDLEGASSDEKLSGEKRVEGSSAAPLKHIDPASPIYENTFRGRELLGRRIANLQGYVLKGTTADDRANSSAPVRGDWNIVSKFDTVTYWNMGQKPTSLDEYPQTFDFLRLQNAVHEI